MALDAGELDLIRETVRDAIESSQENFAQMVARQFVEIRSDIQAVQDAIRKIGTRQAQIEADLSEVGHICEQLKRRVSIIHDSMGTADRLLHEREVSLRLNHLERELAELRSRLPAV
jgi:predicted RNase H-like nuclease (RuvC/YqgF family)